MYFQLALLSVASLCMAFIAIYVSAILVARKEQAKRTRLTPSDGDTAFLFDEELLVDATAEARAILASTPASGSDWSRLLSALISQFPDLKSRISILADEEKLTIESRSGQATLFCEWSRGLARISLRSRADDDHLSEFDRHIVHAMEQELETLRATSENGPLLIWREHVDQTVTWANTAYLTLADGFEPDDGEASWPPRRLFDLEGPAQSNGATDEPSDPKTTQAPARASVVMPDNTTLWFDLYTSDQDDGMLVTAVPVDAAVQTEQDLSDATQTLTNTFSYLTTGLAIFARNRRLTHYNPALADLTGLSLDYLAQSPSLVEFLDKLRDTQMMPEPRDYKSWRQNVSALETQAQSGTFEETWTLTSQVTYRVTGRPLSDGAIAYFFEDISSEVSSSRRLRAQTETGQSVLDSLTDAIAVFENDGRLIMSNTAYAVLWAVEDGDAMHDVGIIESARLWHSKCAPSAVWTDIKDVVAGESSDTAWSGVARLWDGRRLQCSASPLPSGQTVIRFATDAGVDALSHSSPKPADPHYVKM
ncbi:PAS-domain containing protein [Celeribacter marinus]|uniref:PAS-domain containing protein n=1 Tax=Celeribacter marinus TaxID=1397108 RepID=UPI000781BEC3|nr:PAS-domain containing protein [Celeribacter marinus]SFK25973.1 PAS domain-containing protein [Celeribacter marinus]